MTRAAASFWDWAGEAHGRPGVEAACLALQDDHGQCVSYLLWALWASQGGQAPSSEALSQAASIARPWEIAVIRPLRAARRGAKPPLAGIDDPGREALRAAIKAQELAAERLLMEALQAVQSSAAPERADVFGLLDAAAQAWGAPAPSVSALEALARPFSSP